MLKNHAYKREVGVIDMDVLMRLDPFGNRPGTTSTTSNATPHRSIATAESKSRGGTAEKIKSTSPSRSGNGTADKNQGIVNSSPKLLSRNAKSMEV